MVGRAEATYGRGTTPLTIRWATIDFASATASPLQAVGTRLQAVGSQVSPGGEFSNGLQLIAAADNTASISTTYFTGAVGHTDGSGWVSYAVAVRYVGSLDACELRIVATPLTT